MTAIAGSPHAFVVWWKELERWVNPHRTLNPGALPKGWELAKVGDVARQFTTICEVKPDQEYRTIGVKWYGGGTFERETVNGEQISAKYLSPVVPGAFIYNRLFAWKASFAVVPREHDGCFVSNEFPQFIVNESRLNVEYLYLYFTTTKVVGAVQATSVGSAAVSRNRFKEEEFLSFPIPLPPLSVQEAIVAHWRRAQWAASKSRDTGVMLEAEIGHSVLKALGLKPFPRKVEVAKGFALWWKDISRWSLDYIRAGFLLPDPRTSRYPVLPLASLILDLENGWSPKCLPRPARKDEWGVLKLGAVSFGDFNQEENKALPPGLKPLPKLVIEKGNVLISRANIARYVGACVEVQETRPRLLLCDKIFRVLFRAPSLVQPTYLVEVMRTPHLRHQIENAVTGTSPTMKNITKASLLQLLMPAPPLEVQQEPRIWRAIYGRGLPRSAGRQRRGRPKRLAKWKR